MSILSCKSEARDRFSNAMPKIAKGIRVKEDALRFILLTSVWPEHYFAGSGGSTVFDFCCASSCRAKCSAIADRPLRTDSMLGSI